MTIKFKIFIFSLLPFFLNGQQEPFQMPDKLIVVANDLNFRDAPSLNGKIIDKLDYGEDLTLIEVAIEENWEFFYGFDELWLKVKRISTSEEGFVYGKYVQFKTSAYFARQDCERLQPGHWYGLYEKDSRVYLEKTKPYIKTSMDGYNSITSDSTKYQFYICSPNELIEGVMDGYIPKDQYLNIHAGKKQRLFFKENHQYYLACTGNVILDKGQLYTQDKKLHLLDIKSIDGKTIYHNQDLNPYLMYFGAGKSLHFVADINRDGIPDFLLGEGDNRAGANYFFLSNKDGQVKTESITWSYSKC